jgi:hypothetical protein
MAVANGLHKPLRRQVPYSISILKKKNTKEENLLKRTTMHARKGSKEEERKKYESGEGK